MQPRWYQSSLVDQARLAFRKHRALLIQLATGGGKTPTFCWMIQLAVQKGKRVLVLAHRDVLLEQCSQKLKTFDVPHGLISPSYIYRPQYPVQVASIQTMAKRIGKLNLPFDFIVIDEAHLSVAPSYLKVLSHYPKAKILGVTGTARRGDNRGLGRAYGGIYDEIILGPSIAQLTDEGFLVPMRIFSTPAPDLSDVHIVAGEFNRKELSEAVDKPKLVGDMVSHYLKLARGRPTIAFTCSIEHAKHTAQAFRDAGVRAVSLCGRDSVEKQRGVLRDLERGEIDLVANAQLYIEGLDIPGVSCIADMTPTNSLTRWRQKIGRATRPAPGKEDMILLDSAGNVPRFGHPMIEPEWSLAGREMKRKNEAENGSVRICGECFAANRSPCVKCGNCGALFPVKPREVKQVDGELEELTPEKVAQIAERRKQGQAKSLEGLIALGRSRGYQSPKLERWAQHVMHARNLKKQRKVSV